MYSAYRASPESSRDADFRTAIRQRRVDEIIQLMFDDHGRLRSGFHTETELWEYKSDCPPPRRGHRQHWADLAVDVLALHNVHGGILVFGVDDRTFDTTYASHRLDSKLFNDQLRIFIGDRIWVEYQREFIQEDQRYLGFALIPPRGPHLIRFAADSPTGSSTKFKKGESAVRKGVNRPGKVGDSIP